MIDTFELGCSHEPQTLHVTMSRVYPLDCSNDASGYPCLETPPKNRISMDDKATSEGEFEPQFTHVCTGRVATT